jgi:hypothetical protein
MWTRLTFVSLEQSKGYNWVHPGLIVVVNWKFEQGKMS